MLKNITLAALVALGAASLTGVSTQPAAADGYRGGGVYHYGHVSGGVYHRDYGWRRVRLGRHGPRRGFLKRVRQGRVVCFKTRPWRAAYRSDGRAYRMHRVHGRRLGFREVRRLARHGRWNAMRCFGWF
ncbi:MAG: hypothetical protein OEO83_04970 [Alphaproteobacteria bacterium]|nr:hypothetical protein [Alphaproteobacteria bacterium]